MSIRQDQYQSYLTRRCLRLGHKYETWTDGERRCTRCGKPAPSASEWPKEVQQDVWTYVERLEANR